MFQYSNLVSNDSQSPNEIDLKKLNSNKIFFNTCFDKNQIKSLVSWFLDHYGEKKTIDFLEQLKYIGFHQATTAGISLGLDDLEIPPDKTFLISNTTSEMKRIEKQNSMGSLTSVEKSQYLIDTWNQTSEFLRQNAVQNFKNRNCVNPVYMMAFSGARGNISQVRQLVAMRGLMADPQGAILEFPIQSNFREGLTITEYLISCYGARKGLVDTALRTATSGYLTRRLVDAAQHAVVAMTDCNTQNGINLIGKNLESRLLGRVLCQPVKINNVKFEQNHVISQSSIKFLILDTNNIKVRSPLTCESQTTICQMCYGWNLASGKLVTLGEAVGVIAAQSIGEPGTQLTMRTFHTGGVGVFSEQAMKPIFSPYEGQIEFLENLSGHFVRTPHGSIRYMVKYVSQNPNRVLAKVRSLNISQKEFLIYESELPSGSLLVAKHGEYVKARQLLAQSSQLKLTKQKFPESSHPVYSPIEGQIFFESMNLKIQKATNLTGNELTNDVDLVNKNLLLAADLNESSQGLPDTRTITKIGSFWVLASENQYEVHNIQSFAHPGDLVSYKTPLFQYNLYTSQQAQIKIINQKLVIGKDLFKIPITKTVFKSFFYKKQIKTSAKDFLVYQRIKQNIFSQSGLFWYPNSLNFSKKIFHHPNYFYTYLLSEYYSAQNNLNEEIDSNHVSRSISLVKNVKGNFFLLSQPIKILSLSNTNYSFNLTNLLTFKQSKIQGDTKIARKFCNEFYIYQNNFQQKSLFLTTLKKVNKQKVYSQTRISISKNPNCNFRKLNNFDLVKKTSFIEQAVNIIHTKSLVVNNQIITQCKSGWLYLPSKKFKYSFSEFKKRKFIKNSQLIDKNYFANTSLSLEHIPINKVFIGQNKNLKIKVNSNWYDSDNLIQSPVYSEKPKVLVEILNNEFTFINRNKLLFSSKKSLFWHKRIKSLRLQSLDSFQKNKGKSAFNFRSAGTKKPFLLLNVQNNKEYNLFEKKQLKKRWFNLNKINLLFNIRNPLFSKQFSTKFADNKPQNLNFLIKLPQNSGWFFIETLTQINFKNSSKLNFLTNRKHLEIAVTKNYFGYSLSLFTYQHLLFQPCGNFNFQTFVDNWITPSVEFTKGFIRNKTFGEFINSERKPTGTATSILTNNHLITLKLKNPKDLKTTIGHMTRWGDELITGVGSISNGQIMKITPQSITLRAGIPFLASARGIVHIFQNELIQKNQLLITLKSRRLQTEDIVQGIPKIEQLFEARESQSGQILHDTVHTRLRNFFIYELENLQNNDWSTAVENSFLHAQQFLVDGIIEAYSNQGVKISEKHVEVIVRQMTNRVRILTSGETGLLPGEIVEHRWIRNFNKYLKNIGLREATYEPIVVGISKSVLQSDSFLLAASFQEVSRVLVKSALAKKRDFLRGLHENVIVGQLVPAGTGLISQPQLSDNSLKSFSTQGVLNSFSSNAF